MSYKILYNKLLKLYVTRGLTQYRSFSEISTYWPSNVKKPFYLLSEHFLHNNKPQCTHYFSIALWELRDDQINSLYLTRATIGISKNTNPTGNFPLATSPTYLRDLKIIHLPPPPPHDIAKWQPTSIFNSIHSYSYTNYGFKTSF